MNQKIKLFGFIIVILAIPLTVFLAQKVQNIINQAAGPDGKLIIGISTGGGNAPQEGREGQTLAEIDAYARTAGQYPATFSIWNNFGDYGGTSDGTSTAFPPTGLLQGLDARGITPVIFMQPVGAPIHLPSGADPNNPPETAKLYSNTKIAAGKWDDRYLIPWANAAAAYGKPVILRYAQEMNGTWFPWSEWKAGTAQAKNYYNVGNTPANFITSWQHIYSVIKSRAPNVRFLWTPITKANIGTWYPGNNYVDYAGFDAYSHYENGAKSMEEMYAPYIDDIKTITGGNKKIIVGETGVDERFSADQRAAWLTNGFSSMFSNHPKVAGIIYFNFSQWYLWGGGNPVDSAWRSLVSQANYQGRFEGVPLVAVPTPPPAVNNPTGYHDSSDCSYSSGWTCDADDYNSPIDVHFYEGGTFLGAVTANQTRSDLPGAGVCGGNPNHGFAFATPDSLKDGNAHNITAYAINIGSGSTNPVLGNSPKTIQCAPPPAPATPTPIPPTPTGSITASPTSCTVPWNSNSCNATITWGSQNASNVSVGISGPGSFQSGANGSTTTGVAVGSTTFTLYSGGTELDHITVNASKQPTPTGNLSASPNPCTIAWNESTCTTTLSWNTAHTSNAIIKLSDGQGVQYADTSGSVTIPWITDNTFILYDGDGRELDRLRIYGNKQPAPATPTPIPATGSLSASPNPCTIAWNENSCITNLSWNAINTSSITVKLSSGDIVYTGVNGSTVIPWISQSGATFILSDTATGKELNRIAVNANKQSPPAITATPIPTPIPTKPQSIALTNTPTPTKTSSGPEHPGLTPTASPTPVPGTTQLAFAVGLDSIGTTGTSKVTLSSASNKNPLHPQRKIKVEIFNENNQDVAQIAGNLDYVSNENSTNYGKFANTFNLDKDFVSGNYIIKLSVDGYLTKQLPGTVIILAKQNNNTPLVNLITGDINLDNRLSILDYNLLISCSIFAKTDAQKSACNTDTKFKTFADVNDDGVIDQIDYSYFLQEYSIQSGD